MRVNNISLMVVLATFSAATYADEVVNISNWNGYIADDTLPTFTKETGIKATYDIHDSNEVLESKLMTGNTGYDVVSPSNHFLSRLIKAGAISNSIHYANPNLAADQYVVPAVKQDLAIYPPTNVLDTLFTVEELPAAIARLTTRLWTKLKTNT